MSARKVETTKIDTGHALARVSYCSDDRRADGSDVAIEFEASYLLDLTGARPKIFAFVAGDEMALHHANGLIPRLPEPPPVTPKLGEPTAYARPSPPAPGDAACPRPAVERQGPD